jgi:hypothetical protein
MIFCWLQGSDHIWSEKIRKPCSGLSDYKGSDELLQKYTNSKRITVGVLISTILIKYSQWDRYTEKFEMITLRQEIIKAILEVIEDEALIRKVREIGAKTPQRISYVLVQKNRS